MEQAHIVPVLSADKLTHDVYRFRVGRPPGYNFTPGQATEVSINKPEWIDKRRPFTFTSLQDQPWLEFIIKSYPDSNGVTKELSHLKTGDSLVLRDVWGAIAYRGPGYFIAGRAGITPFIAILRQLNKDGALGGNKLIFANKTRRDIILKDELDSMLGSNAVHVLSADERGADCISGHIDMPLLKKHIEDPLRFFYVCGPDRMVKDISSILEGLGVPSEHIVFER